MLPEEECSMDAVKPEETSQLLAAWKATAALLSAEEAEEHTQSTALVDMGSIKLNKTGWTVCLQCRYCEQIFKNMQDFVEHASKHLLTVGECDSELLLQNAKKVDLNANEQEKQQVMENIESAVGWKDDDFYAEDVEYLEDEYDEMFMSNQSVVGERECEPKYVDIEYLQKYENEPKFKRMDKPSRAQCDALSEMKRNKAGYYQCEVCNVEFESFRRLRSHMKQHEIGRALCCDWCSATFLDNSNLRVHIRRHLGVKPHTCALCVKSFISTTELKLHMRTHTGERPYDCKYCARRFTSSAHLKSHMRRHTNDRPYACDMCDKRFYDRRLLTDHQAIHSNVRPYECEVCGQNFPRRKSLVEHYKLHSIEKRYHCTICGKAFAQNSGLYVHMRTHGHDGSEYSLRVAEECEDNLLDFEYIIVNENEEQITHDATIEKK